MGYTHNWHQSRDLKRDEWSEIREDFAAIFSYAQHIANIPLANGMGDAGTQPDLTEHDIGFNGVGDAGCETFFIRHHRDPEDYEFCKTARESYDTVVVACLCYLSTCLEPAAFRISSDGNGHDFLEGLDLARKAIPRKANILDIPMGVMQDDRWTGPWLHPKSKTYHVGFCINGKGYVTHNKTGVSYCFPSHLALAEFLHNHREAKFPGGRRTFNMGRFSTGYDGNEPDIWNASGSFDQHRTDRLTRTQDKVLKTLFPVPAEHAEQPPLFVRPNDFPRPEENGTFCYYMEDVFKRYGTHTSEGVSA